MSYACDCIQEHNGQQQFSAEFLKCIAGGRFFSFKICLCPSASFCLQWKKTTVPSGPARKVPASLLQINKSGLILFVHSLCVGGNLKLLKSMYKSICPFFLLLFFCQSVFQSAHQIHPPTLFSLLQCQCPAPRTPVCLCEVPACTVSQAPNAFHPLLPKSFKKSSRGGGGRNKVQRQREAEGKKGAVQPWP